MIFDDILRLNYEILKINRIIKRQQIVLDNICKKLRIDQLEDVKVKKIEPIKTTDVEFENVIDIFSISKEEFDDLFKTY